MTDGIYDYKLDEDDIAMVAKALMDYTNRQRHTIWYGLFYTEIGNNILFIIVVLLLLGILNLLNLLFPIKF